MSEINLPKTKNRPGAGRKIGTGKFGESTSVLRVPESQKTIIVDYLEAVRISKKLLSVEDMPRLFLAATEPSHILIDRYSNKIAAGLPSEVEAHVEDQIDINSFLVQHKGRTFIAPVESDSLKDLGLVRNHYVVVNRDIKERLGDVIAAIVNNGFTLKILSETKDGRPLLKKANPDPQYKDIEIKEGMDYEVWGVVTGLFAKL